MNTNKAYRSISKNSSGTSKKNGQQAKEKEYINISLLTNLKLYLKCRYMCTSMSLPSGDLLPKL